MILGFSLYEILIYLLFYASAAGFAYVLSGLFLKFSKNLGIRNEQETIIRWSSQQKPALGGIVFYILFLLSIACYSVVFNDHSILQSKKLLGILGASALAFMMGLSDDAYNTKPLLKLSAQIGCGVILISTGTFIDLFSSMLLNYLLTMVWVIGIMNSINMLDNMDAIASIVSFFIMATALMIIFCQPDPSPLFILILTGIAAAISGFLFYNWHPSKIFMGDTGSQFLGVMLAITGIIFFWNFREPGLAEAPSRQIIIVLLAFIPMLVDTTTVTINRLLKGKSPMIGGKDHTTHHLSYLGFSDKQVALIFALISSVSFVLIFTIINFINAWNHLYTVTFVAYFLVIFIALYRCTRIQTKKEKLHEQKESVPVSSV